MEKSIIIIPKDNSGNGMNGNGMCGNGAEVILDDIDFEELVKDFE